MKRFLSWLLFLLPLGASAQTSEEPSDPNQLHKWLYQKATDLVQPYLFLDGKTKKDTKTTKARADLEEGVVLLRRVLEIDPENWAAAWFAGKAAQSLGDEERAYTFFRRSYELQKQNPDVARELMIACLETERAKEGVEIAEHAISVSLSDAGLLANLALAKLMAGDVKGAEASINESLVLNPHDQISVTLKKMIGEVSRGERPLPKRPADLQKK